VDVEGRAEFGRQLFQRNTFAIQIVPTRLKWHGGECSRKGNRCNGFVARRVGFSLILVQLRTSDPLGCFYNFSRVSASETSAAVKFFITVSLVDSSIAIW